MIEQDEFETGAAGAPAPEMVQCFACGEEWPEDEITMDRRTGDAVCWNCIERRAQRAARAYWRS